MDKLSKASRALILSLLFTQFSAFPARAGTDAEIVSSQLKVSNINNVGDIWSAEIPDEIQFEKTSTYPCGDLVLTFKGLLPYAVLADKSRGVSINLDIWSDNGAKIASGSLSEYEWNPVGPLTQEKLFICGKNVTGNHTIIIETIYETASNGLQSRYLSSTMKQNIKIGIKKDPPAVIQNFKASWEAGSKLRTNWTTPNSELEIISYQLGLFETSNDTKNSNSDLNTTPKILETLIASTTTKDLTWSSFEKISANSNSIYKIRIRALSAAGPGGWSSAYILEPSDLLKYLIPLTEKPPPPLFNLEYPEIDPTQIFVNLSSANFVSTISKFKVTSWISKIKTESGIESIGNISPINGPGNYRLIWNGAHPGKYQIAAAFINENGQGEWTEFKEIVLPIPTLVTEEKTSASTNKKKKNITCIKGKTIKIVSGISPKCPSGFKKK